MEAGQRRPPVHVLAMWLTLLFLLGLVVDGVVFFAYFFVFVFLSSGAFSLGAAWSVVSWTLLDAFF